MKNLYVIKIGSRTILERPEIFAELKRFVDYGAKVLVVCGGAEAIRREHASCGLTEEFLTLSNGSQARYCHKDNMDVIVRAYEKHIGAAIVKAGQRYHFSWHFQIAGNNRLVCGKQGKPLKVIKDGRSVIVRDSRYGGFVGCNQPVITSLLKHYDVVFVSPPVCGEDDQMINIDADMLAANLAVALQANHLRFVTSTAGVLADTSDPLSTIADVFHSDVVPAMGRMKQKVRAANFAVQKGVCDISINGPHSLHSAATWFWRGNRTDERLQLFSQMVNISSISKDERELAQFVTSRVNESDITKFIDQAGNVVLAKGQGHKTLLMLGHIDTVPGLWPSEANFDFIKGRGAVDAKGCFANFIEVLKEIPEPENSRILVIGAVEEEISSSKGAFYVRDNYRADAVIIGEPSGTHQVTIAYHGLLKLVITVRTPVKHTAAKENGSSVETAYRVATEIKECLSRFDNDCVHHISDVCNEKCLTEEITTMTLNLRISPLAREGYLAAISQLDYVGVTIEVERATPGYKSSRSSLLYKAFNRGFKSIDPHTKLKAVAKKGTSDINSLVTTWNQIPFIAYGPGDSSLDHTNEEINFTQDIVKSRNVLKKAVMNWIEMTEGQLE